MMKPFVVIYIFFIALLTFSFQWPLSKIIVTATFGESRGDHFHSGIDLAGDEVEIKPISPGEVVFYYAEVEGYSSLPVGLGNYLVLEDQAGIRSLYAHIKKGTIPHDKKRFEQDETIGLVGASGYSLGKHLHLTIIDYKEKTILNPLILFKNEGKILADKKSPVMNNLFYKNSEGKLTQLLDDTFLNIEKVDLFVSAYDIQDNTPNPVAPYEIVVEHNEMKVITIVFNALQFTDDDYRLNSCGKSFSDLYTYYESDSNPISLGEIVLIKGKNQIRVLVNDLNGNSTAREVNIWAGSPP
jgi:murein DD-endopeptidase MepM/ murein hydrolase activator NlpD